VRAPPARPFHTRSWFTARSPYDHLVRERPKRLDRLPEQYFTALLARVAAAAARTGEPLVDLGRGNPEVGPPEHVVHALAESAERPDVHGYAPFSGLPALKEAIAQRYGELYDAHIDPAREVAVLPGTKTGLMEFALCAVEHGGTIVLPDPGYPDYFSAVALAGACRVPFSGFDTSADAMYLNFPSNPTAATVPDGLFEDAVRWAERSQAWILHDFAYGDLVFDGRRPQSFLAVDGARRVGIELFSMSKSYGMAGWRLGFAVGNAELVRRIELLQDHAFAGIFRPVQEAGIAALTGPQDSVEERRATYERRRDRALAALDGVEAQSQGTFFVWLRLPESVTTEQLLVEHRVAVAPGEGFGARGGGWARLSLAVPDETLELGLQRLQRALR
jgi:aminotransferase